MYEVSGRSIEALPPVPSEYFEDRAITRDSKAFIRLSNGKYLFYGPDGSTDDHPYTIDINGGRAEEGETDFEAFRREALEEIDAEIDPESVVYARAYRSEKQPDKVAWLAVVELTEELSLRLCEEGLELIEMEMDEYLAAQVVYPYFQERIGDYLS